MSTHSQLVAHESCSSVTAPPGLENYHPLDPVGAFDVYPKLARFRKECPVFRTTNPDHPPVTFFTRYADIAAILRDHDSFQSMGTNVTFEDYELIPPDERTHIELNPPEHTDVRRLLLSAVAPPAIKRVIPLIEKLGAQIVDQFANDGKADMVAQWAAHMPGLATAYVMGLPPEDGPQIHQWVQAGFSDEVLKLAEAERGQARGAEMGDDFDSYIRRQIELRRNGTVVAEDGISNILRYTPRRGYPFTDKELVQHIHSVLVAANETSASFMANAIRRIVTTPGMYQRLRDDRSLIDPAIRELTRFDPPLLMVARGCRQVSTIGGVTIRPGEGIVLSLASANRDKEIWGEDADEFRPERFVTSTDKDVMTFGTGIHFCPGSHLAKLETNIALNALFDRIKDMRFAPGAEFLKVWYYLLDRPKEVQVEFDLARCEGETSESETGS